MRIKIVPGSHEMQTHEVMQKLMNDSMCDNSTLHGHDEERRSSFKHKGG